MHPLRNLLALVLCLSVASCGSSGPSRNTTLPTPPSNLEGFPGAITQNQIMAEAEFRRNHRDVFGENLPNEQGTLPINLRIGTLDESASNTLIDRERFDLRLILEDGTVLAPREVDAVMRGSSKDGTRQKIRTKALDVGPLFQMLEIRREGLDSYVYFKLPKGSEMDGEELVLASGQALRISRSLVTFQALVQGSMERFYVGVRGN